MSESVLGIWLMALGWVGLMELGAGGGDELVWTDQGVPNPGREGEHEPPLALCISWAGRFGKAAPRPPDNMLPVLLLPLWWTMGESIWILFGFTEVGDGDAASASVSSREESQGSAALGKGLNGPSVRFDSVGLKSGC